MNTPRAATALAWLLTTATVALGQPANQGAGGRMGSGMQGMQGMGGMGGTCPYNCPMCGMMGGPMGIVTMVLGGALVLAVIGVLVALTVFLFRRSRPPAPPSLGLTRQDE